MGPERAEGAPEPKRSRPRPGPRPPAASERPALVGPSGVLGLQSSAGNQAVQGLVAQRIFGLGDSRTDEQRITDALRTRDPADVKAIEDVNKADSNQKFELLDILAHQGWAGPRDEWQMEKIWASFGGGLTLAMAAHQRLWNDCVDKGAALGDLAEVKALKARFADDVVALTDQHLTTNGRVVTEEMGSFGISADAAAAAQPPTADQAQKIRDVQTAAMIVAEMQRGQRALDGVQVGWERDPDQDARGRLMPAYFSRWSPPQLDRNDEPGVRSHTEVADQYDAAARVIRLLVNRFPALYAVSRQGEAAASEAFSKLASPQQAQAELGTQLRKLKQDIDGTKRKVTSRELDPRELLPIHAQLTSGGLGASGTRWGEPLERFAAKEAVGDKAREDFWVRLGLESLSAAAFLLAPFTGGASLLVLTVGAGAAAAQASMSHDRYENLAKAARTNVTADTELVLPAQEVAAKAQADADLVAAAIAVLLVGAGAVAKGVSMGRAFLTRQAVEGFARTEARALLAAAAREEIAVTGTLRGVAEGGGGRLAGLENALKSEESLTRKIADLATVRVATGATPQAAVAAESANIKDALRYTMEVPTKDYMATYERTVQTLKGQGYEQTAVRNTWARPGSDAAGPYRGINSNWKTPTGQIFELQFHTPESFATKTLTHAMYEELRAAGTSAARIAELRAKMTEISDRIPVPPGAVP